MSGQTPQSGTGSNLGMGIPQPNQPAYGIGQGLSALQMMGAPQPQQGPYPGMSGFGAAGGPNMQGAPMQGGMQPGPPGASYGGGNAQMPPMGQFPRQSMGGPMPPMGPPMGPPVVPPVEPL